jgi:hypothetical protein
MAERSLGRLQTFSRSDAFAEAEAQAARTDGVRDPALVELISVVKSLQARVQALEAARAPEIGIADLPRGPPLARRFEATLDPYDSPLEAFSQQT